MADLAPIFDRLGQGFLLVRRRAAANLALIQGKPDITLAEIEAARTEGGGGAALRDVTGEGPRLEPGYQVPSLAPGSYLPALARR